MVERLHALRFTSLAIMTSAAALATAQPAVPANVPLGPGTQRLSEGTAHLVASLLAYVRWPARPEALRVCIAGPAQHADLIGAQQVAGDGAIAARAVQPGSPGAAAGCDALYIGGLAPAATAQAVAAVRGRPVVTIVENDPACRSEAMFCLVYGPDAISFRLNVDAVSRSPVRVDPRVLRLARGQGG